MRKQLSTLWRTIDAALERDLIRQYDDLALPGYRSPDARDARAQLLDVLSRTGVEHRRFVDIGCGRSGGHSGLLAEGFGWSGIFVDASTASVEAMRRRFAHRRDVCAIEMFVTAENVNELELDRADVVCIDIDSYDYWVWKALAARPRVLVIEYNAFLGLDPLVVPYGAIPEPAPKGYSGASLTALEKLGREKGYALAGVDSQGVNAFFVRGDVAPDEVSAADAFRPILDRYAIGDVPRDTQIVMDGIERAGLRFEQV